MAGHSKWANTKHRKARADAQKGKIFTKLAREIAVAAREGGSDLETNSNLRIAVQKAKDNNMPNNNIQRAIQKGTGNLEGESYEYASYEGYAVGGVAVLLEAMTDNLNRTVAEIRYIFSRHGGSLGESGCVAWMFSRKGFISADLSDTEFDEDELMMTALETGAEDVEKEDDGTYSITTEMESFEAVKNKLQEQGINIFSSELTMLPSTIVEVTNPDSVRQILSLMDALEDHDDALNVYANYNIPDELLVKQ